MNRKNADKIVRRLVLWLVFFSTLLAILGTVTQTYLDYRKDLNRVSASLEHLTFPHISQVSRSLETGNITSLAATLENLLLHNELVYAMVVAGGTVVWQDGEKPAGRVLSASFPLVSPGGGGVVPDTGSLEVFADIEPIKRQVTTRFAQTLLGDLIKVVLIAGFVYLVFQYSVTRHLVSLAAQVRQLDCTSPHIPLHLNRRTSDGRDELDQVVSAINAKCRSARQRYKTLAREEQQLRLFLDSTEEAIIGVDRFGACSFANDACLRLLGLNNVGPILYATFQDLIRYSCPGANKELTGESLILQCMEESRALRCEDGTIVCNDGKTLPISLRCYPVYADRAVSGAVIFMKDTAEKRQLRREWTLLSEAVRQIPVMIVIADSSTHIEFVNASVEKLTGFGGKELLGQPVLRFREMIVASTTRLNQIKATLQSEKQWEGELEFRTRWGGSIQVYSIVSAVLDEHGDVKHFISFSREICYEVALQKELVNAKKMEAVGRLSAKFAHEFGNPLFGVRSVLKDFCNRTDLTTEDSRLLYLAHQECERMRVMIREFQQLYQDSTGAEEIVTLADIIRKVLQNIKQLMEGLQVQCSVELTEESRFRILHKNKLFLVLRNIIVNAVEAMAQTGGRLEISDREKGGVLIVSITDEGRGIKKEHQELIFEPFFSTKSEVEGAGLGLSFAYGTMTSIGGNITFSSTEGEGTEFLVYIPLH